MDEQIAVRFEHFTFQYYAQAEPTLHDINLEIRKHEKVLIVGPSGSGKSTLAHCINGFPSRSKERSRENWSWTARTRRG